MLILTLIKDASPPIFWTMMFMLLNVFINSEDISSAPCLSTRMNAILLSWFLNVVRRNLGMSWVGSLILGVNTIGYEVAEHIAKKIEVNPQMISALKNAKSIWSMKPGAIFKTSVVVPLGILVALFKRKIDQVYSDSVRFSGRPSMFHLLVIRFSLAIEPWPKRWWVSWERCF